MATKTEHYDGSDCTGTTGTANRTLTISNTGTTSGNGFLVYSSGLALALTDEYTVDHNSSSTVITFILPVWDDQKIIVQYSEEITGSESQADGNDFINGPLSDFGVTVTRTPVTTTTDFHGDKIYTDGTDEDIDVVFGNPNKAYNLDKPGLTEVYDAIMYIKQDQTMSKYDKITHDSKVYKVGTVSPRNFNGNAMFKTVNLFFLKDE